MKDCNCPRRKQGVTLTRIFVTIFIASLLTLTSTGCSNSTLSTTLTASQTIVSKTLSALSGVKSFNLETDITNNYKLIGGPTTDITEWEGTKLVGVSNQEMEMNMTIAEIYSGTNINASLEMYFKDGEEYLKTVATGLYQQNPWTKTQLNSTLWNSEAQLSYLTELLKNAAQYSSVENEKVNGIDCYVLTITSSVQATIDFVVSQEQPFGTQIDVMWGGGIPIVRQDAYKNGSIQLWINQKNYLPVKVDVNIDFQGDVGGGSGITISPTTNPIDSNFQGELNFSNYNQSVSIQLPQEALNAQIIGN